MVDLLRIRRLEEQGYVLFRHGRWFYYAQREHERDKREWSFPHATEEAALDAFDRLSAKLLFGERVLRGLALT